MWLKINERRTERETKKKLVIVIVERDAGQDAFKIPV
jgi:hypothetical protein